MQQITTLTTLAVLRRTDNANIGQSYVDVLTLPLHNLIFTIKIENL